MVGYFKTAERTANGLDDYDLIMFDIRFSALALTCAVNVAAQTLPARPSPLGNNAPPGNPATSVNNSAMDGELMYQLLLGELSNQTGEPATAYSLLLDAARKTNDPRLYQRAVDIALQARSGDSALVAARAWRQALPNSKDANRYLLQILIGLNRMGELVDPIKRDIALTDTKERALAIAAIPRYFSRATDKKLAASVVEQSLVDYTGTAPMGVTAWTTIGRMRIEAADLSGAVEAARRAQVFNAQAEGPALLAIALLNPPQAGAESIVRKYLDGKPQAEVRLEYARALLNAQRYAEATAQITLITQEKPDLAEAWLIQGSLELQDNRLDRAEKSLKRFIDTLGSRSGSSSNTELNRGLVQAYLSLAQIAELRKDFPQAESWLAKISSPEDMVRTQSRRASIMARQGRLDEAIGLIRSLPGRNQMEQRMKLSAEVQLLRDNKRYQAAFDLLAAATTRDPTDFDLTYDQATLAEKLGNFDEMELLLRRIMAGKPDYHHAYNALGYSLAERSVRLPEAKQLILKALEFAPNDPFITDSLGWVEFRMGNLAQALRILQGAFKARPDAEIAAHLGEVLWVMGKRDEATAIWREGAMLNAENETLLETLKRFRVKQ
jgi:tetratricopeptide (TPR) repeat protein